MIAHSSSPRSRRRTALCVSALAAISGASCASAAAAPAAAGPGPVQGLSPRFAHPCVPLPPAERPDPRTAAAYAEVGASEQAAGRRDTALAAYREALRLDATNARARAGLDALCSGGAAHFEEGLAHFEAGEHEDAARAFAQARAAGMGPAAALLEGVALYELGQDEAARPRLAEAASDPSVAEAAQLFLGLVKLRAGAPAEAAAHFEVASGSADPRLGPLARDLLRTSRRDGRLVLSLLSEAAFDSNVDLAPDGTPALGDSRDGAGTLLGTLTAAPFGTRGPYLRLRGQIRKQLSHDALDLGALGAAVGWRFGEDGRFLAAEYSYERVCLDGAPHLAAHHGTIAGRWPLDPLSLRVRYQARLGAFSPQPVAGYSGVLHEGELEATWRFPAGAEVSAAWRSARDAARDPTLAYWEHGPRAELVLPLAAALRAGIGAAVTWRFYSSLDPDFALLRRDVYLDGAAFAELDLGLHFALRTPFTARRALSNAPGLTYTKVTLGLALAFTAGAL